MNDRVFLDTNVLVYVFDSSEAKKQARARERLAAERHRSELVISTQVLQELYNALTRGAKPLRQPEEAAAAVRDAAKLTVIQVDPPLILEAIVLCRREQLSFWDALIVESAKTAGCMRLLSEDLSHGRSYGTITVENPFAGL